MTSKNEKPILKLRQDTKYYKTHTRRLKLKKNIVMSNDLYNVEDVEDMMDYIDEIEAIKEDLKIENEKLKSEILDLKNFIVSKVVYEDNRQKINT